MHNKDMEKRTLGKTGLEVSIIGFGGFHLVEIPFSKAKRLLNRYLDEGGNYIETAESYGDGISEQKIGKAVSGRRSDFILATKTTARTGKEAMAALHGSLKRLKTDYVDIWFMHAVQTEEEAEAILAPGGAMEAVLKARNEGKVRFAGITGHGKPAGLIPAVKDYNYDVLMTGLNFFDRFNFPGIEDSLLPLCVKKKTAILAMKVLADGYLFRSPETAIRYTLRLPVASLVLGINRMEYLEKDMEIVRTKTALDNEELEETFEKSVELGDYVCRLCGKCKNTKSIDPMEVFLLEGIYDRQMNDYRVPDPQEYALRERLKFWFDQKELAQSTYLKVMKKVDTEKDYSYLNKLCPYGIDIDRKLKIAHSKLAGTSYIF